MTEQRDADSPSANSQQFNEPTDSATTESVDDSWTNRIGGVWNNATSRLTKLLPVEQVGQTVSGWFSVSEDQVAEILETVRAELPTTEALLIGKPQAGKSSIVRGLTGVSAEIVGQGFRPHTQHTQRYAYPSSDLPLLIFTDTVGLGDVNQDTQVLVQELIGDLQQENRRARVLILTVKINDFATDTLRQIAQQLRQQYPDIPCLLAVTCLHEVYPPSTADHPTYPPNYEELNRAFAAIEKAFAGLCDRAVMIDFTLEEDGYNPVFYGSEALRDSLADLLPEAEARAIYQLLDQEAGEQLGISTEMLDAVICWHLRSWRLHLRLCRCPLPPCPY
jgi:GTP-binding protein EngB required for normal cell division